MTLIVANPNPRWKSQNCPTQSGVLYNHR